MKQELMTAVQVSRKCHEQRREPSVALSNGWTVRADRIANTPRGGPMAAWKYVYYLVSPQGKQFGGYDRQDSFVAWACRFMKEQSNG